MQADSVEDWAVGLALGPAITLSSRAVRAAIASPGTEPLPVIMRDQNDFSAARWFSVVS